MSSAHIFYIPVILILGLVLGYKMGLGAMRKEIERRRKRGEDI
jgi:hypothetical protein